MQDSSTPFKLETGPLVRADRDSVACQCAGRDLKRAPRGGRWLVAGCPLGRSRTLVLAFVGNARAARAARTRFSDFVRYCSTPENSARIQASRSFWQRKLGVVPAALSLAYDGKRPPSRSYGAHHAGLSMPAASWRSSRRLRVRGSQLLLGHDFWLRDAAASTVGCDRSRRRHSHRRHPKRAWKIVWATS